MKVTILFQSFHSYQQTSSEENAQNAEKLGGGGSSLKQQNFVIIRYI